MPNPILHSRLAKLLQGNAGSTLSQPLIQNLLIATRAGVFPEGAGVAEAKAMADHFGDALREGDETATSTLTAKPSGSEGQGQQQVTAPTVPKFRLGKASEQELVGVRPELVKVVRLAISLTEQDFTVYEGTRTLKAQVNNVKIGVSQTLHSKHLIQPDGFSHAVDLVPYINGRPMWDWDGCYRVAVAMTNAATQLGLAHRIIWGGAWDRRLADFTTLGGQVKVEEVRAAVEGYKNRHAGPDFLDGPHFQWED